MRLGFCPPPNRQALLDYALRLKGFYSFIELPAWAWEELAPAIPELRAMGYELTLHARFEDLNLGTSLGEIREASIKVLLEDFERAASYGFVLVNVHAGSLPWLDDPPPGLSPEHERLRGHMARMRAAAFDRALDAMARLADQARRLGLRLTLENLAMPQEYPRSPEEMARFLAIDHLEFCLDVGHARIAAQPLTSFQHALGARLTHAHVHDNDGHFDLHLAPSPQLFASLRGLTALVELPPRSVAEYLEVALQLGRDGLEAH
jgi:sugar phosphate isomerase/epimerase